MRRAEARLGRRPDASSAVVDLSAGRSAESVPATELDGGQLRGHVWVAMRNRRPSNLCPEKRQALPAPRPSSRAACAEVSSSCCSDAPVQSRPAVVSLASYSPAPTTANEYGSWSISASESFAISTTALELADAGRRQPAGRKRAVAGVEVRGAEPVELRRSQRRDDGAVDQPLIASQRGRRQRWPTLSSQARSSCPSVALDALAWPPSTDTTSSLSAFCAWRFVPRTTRTTRRRRPDAGSRPASTALPVVLPPLTQRIGGTWRTTWRTLPYRR